MIIKSWRRGDGRQLALYLLDAAHNEHVELLEIRGAVANDLPGACAEWDFQAKALTKLQNPFYCTAISPDPAQESPTREQILDLIARGEKRLGLEDQPRAIVIHVHEGRTHWHVFWPRTDRKNERGIELPFDHPKWRAETIEWANVHGFELPDGYFGKSENISQNLFDKVKKNETGLSKNDHVEAITEAWELAENPDEFVAALADRGYLLATGDRPYVVVDIYGYPHALARMLKGMNVYTKELREFLGNDYPIEALPYVDEAKKMVAEFSEQLEANAFNERAETEKAKLKKTQKIRPERLENDRNKAALKQHRKQQHAVLQARQKTQRDNLRSAYLAEKKFIRSKRHQRKPKGIASFLGRITGINKIRSKVYKFHDRQHLHEFLRKKNELKLRHERQREELKWQQIHERRPVEKEERDLDALDRREVSSLERKLRKEARIAARGGTNVMPAIKRAADKSGHEKGSLSIGLNTASGIRTKARKKGDLRQAFLKANGTDERDGSGEEKGSTLENKRHGSKRRRRRDRGKDQGRDR